MLSVTWRRSKEVKQVKIIQTYVSALVITAMQFITIQNNFFEKLRHY